MRQNPVSYALRKILDAMAKTGKTRASSNLATLWFFFRPYKSQIMALLILYLLVGSVEALNIAAVYPILNAAFNIGAEQSNVVFALLRTMTSLLPIEDEFIASCVLFLLIALLAFVAKLISLNFRVDLTATLVVDNQSKVFNKYMRADYQYFIDHKEGELIYNAAVAPGQMAHLIIAVTELTSQGILSLSIILLLFSLSWQGTAAVLLVGIGYYLLTRYLGEKVSYHAGKGEMEALREINVILDETISGIKQVKVFVTEENWINRFANAVKKRFYHFSKHTKWEQIPSLTLMLVLYLSIGIVALLLRITAPGAFTQMIPVLGTFGFAGLRLFPIMGTVGGLMMSIMGVMPNCEAVRSIQIDKITHIEDGKRELISFKSNVQFHNVSFAYKGRPKTIEELSVTFERGKTVAIVGRSGSGKTTIIALLLRLFDPNKGEIKIDGVNLKEYKLSSWLSNIGLVSQDTFILNDTVENNITFGTDRYSREAVVEAAECADAHSFITELPEGYDTIVGDKGVKLSGGQRQRIAIARAVIKKPEVLIFDEATNALDNISEVLVQNAIDRIAEDHTVIIIAHRLSTIANADEILVLEDGRVVEQGTHDELIENRGAYWGLYQSQSL